MHLTFFIFNRTFYLIASYQILRNDAILINYGSFFQKKDSLQLKRFQFSRMNKLLPNSAILFWKIDFKWFYQLMNLFPRNRNCKVVRILFPEKMIRYLLESHHYVKFSMKQ